MKSILIAILIGVSICALPVLSVDANAKRLEVRVVAVTGSPILMESNGISRELKVGQMLNRADKVTTSPGASVDIAIAGGVVRVPANSTIGLEEAVELEGGGVSVLLNIHEGSLLCKILKVAGKSKVEIKTANGVIGLSGSSLSVDSAGTTHVLEGVVRAVYVLHGNVSPPIAVHAGESLSASRGVESKPTPMAAEITKSLASEFKTLGTP